MVSEKEFRDVMPDRSTERVVLVYVILLLLLEIIGGFSISPILTFAVCLFSVICLLSVPVLTKRFDRLPIHILYVIYIMPVLYILYPVALGITRGLHEYCFDDILMAVDRSIFGGINPTQWIYTHIHLSGLTVELLGYSYFAHYLYPLVLGTELFAKKEYQNLRDFRFVMIYGAVLSFIINIAIPAIGPRFTLHEFADLTKELPGVWIMDVLRGQLNTGEGITAMMTSKEATLHVLRDAFPSGHTMLTVMTLLVAFRFKAKVRWVLLPLGISLIISTVLLRYHYVIDVIAGIAFAIFVVRTAPSFWKFIGKKKPNVQADD